MVRKNLTLFLKYFIIILVIISLVKLSVAYTYECKLNNKAEYRINFYIYPVESESSPNNTLSSPSPVLIGNAVVKISNNNIIIEYENSTVLLKMIYKDNSYLYVLRNGKMLNAGISPFYLSKPCLDPLYRNIFKFSYLNINLKYDFVKYFTYTNGTFHDFGLVVYVTYPNNIRFFNVYYASGIGVEGEFVVTRDVFLFQPKSINSTKLYIFSYSIDLNRNSQLPTGLKDVYPVAIPGIAFGITLIVYGLRAVLLGRR